MAQRSFASGFAGESSGQLTGLPPHPYHAEFTMHLWFPVLILSAQTAAPIDQQYAEAVYETRFEQEREDLNYDGWPDDWTRRKGRGYPLYVKIAIAEDLRPRPTGSHCLQIELDGGSAAAFSPPIKISPLYSYVFEGFLRTRNLKHNSAHFSVTFYDQKHQKQQTLVSSEYREVPDWTKVRIGPLMPAHREAAFAVIGLHVTAHDRADLEGVVQFDDLQLARFPRMNAVTNGDFNVFYDPNDVEVTCSLSGIQRPDPLVHFELLDVDGLRLANSEVHVNGSGPGEASAWLSFVDADSRSLGEIQGQGGFAGTATWKPPIPGRGFYRVRVSMRGESDNQLTRTISLAVLNKSDNRPAGEFGWSLPGGQDPLPVNQLFGLLSQVGINWVKFPVWYDDQNKHVADQIAWFADRLSTQGIEMVGMLDCPPESVRTKFGDKLNLTIAEVFLEPEIWHHALDPIMIRLSLKVQWWQLGRDEEESFIDFPGLERVVQDVRSHIEQFGQKTRMGLAWRWVRAVPESEQPAWNFVSLTEELPFTSAELKRYLDDEGDVKSARWLTLKPLSRGTYDAQSRAHDLVLRMLEAKVHRRAAIFVSDPFDAQHGLMNRDGTPDELLLPWVVTARTLGGAEYLGSFVLPNGSHNHVFARDDEAVMVVWNDKPTTEVLYLGDKVQLVDLWGREMPTSEVEDDGVLKQQLAVGPLPVFVTGMDRAIARWRLGFAFDKTQLASVFGRPQTSIVRFRNTFPRGLGGSLTLHVPDVWELSYRSANFKLATEEEREQPFEIALQTVASSGVQRVRIDFDITSDRRYRFSVYRDLQVGLGDVVVELHTWLNEDGKLVVEQHLSNDSAQRLSLNCTLFVPGRRRQRLQVYELGRTEVTNIYVLPNGQELMGKTLWLRAEEMNGPRVLNYQVVAEP